MPRALIVGAGLSGLAAAIFLRKIGLETLVLEKSSQTAPLIRGFRRKGLPFETGFHYAGGLGPGGILRDYLESLGVWPYLKAEALPDPGGESLRFIDGGDYLLPGRFEEFRRLFPADPAIDDFFQKSRQEFSASPFLNPALRSRPAEEHDRHGPTLAQALSGLELSPQERTLLSFRCFLYGVKPSESSFTDFSLVNVPYLSGVHSFEGGGQDLAEAFERAARSAGVSIENDREVIALETDGNNQIRALTVRNSEGREERLSCDYCVFSGNPASLPRLLPAKALRPVLVRRLANLKQTPSPFMLFASTGTAFLAGRQFFLLGRHDLESGFAGDGGAVYVSGGPGRGGRWPLTVISFLPEEATSPWRSEKFGQRSAAYRAFKEGRSLALKKYLLKQCPELAGDLEIHDSASDLSLAAYSFNSGRGIYGRLHSVNEAPVLPLVRVKGLVLAGQNIVLPGLLGTVVSAALAAGCLMGLDKVWEVLRG